MSTVVSVTDVNKASQPITGSAFEVIATNAAPAIIEASDLTSIGRMGYQATHIDLFSFDPIIIGPIGTARNVDVEGKLDGVSWEKLIPTQVYTGAETELQIITGLQNLYFRFPVRITIAPSAVVNTSLWVNLSIMLKGDDDIR